MVFIESIRFPTTHAICTRVLVPACFQSPLQESSPRSSQATGNTRTINRRLSRATTRDVFLLSRRACLLLNKTCSTRRRVSLLNGKICLRVHQEDTSSCSTRRHDVLLNKEACLLVQQKDMYSSCSPRRHVFLLNFLFNKKACPLVEKEDISSCSATTPRGD